MIEVLGTKTGDMTLKVDGKYLSSSVDPRAEAKKWVERVGPTLRGLRSVLVLSAGAGHHLSELKRNFPHLNVIALEKRSEVVRELKNSIQISLLGVEMVVINTLEQAFENAKVIDALKASYAVVKGPAANHIDKAFYSDVQLALNGRSAFGFEKLCLLRGLTSTGRAPAHEWYSYKDLESDGLSDDVERFAAYKVIGELVR